MLVISDEIRLSPAHNGVEVIDTDWAINPKRHTMQHEPTKTVFHINLDEKENESEPLSSTDFSATLVAIGEGCALPPPEMIETLGRQALVLYFVATGLIRPQTEASLAEDHEQAYAC
jgi:hypothetical protein